MMLRPRALREAPHAPAAPQLPANAASGTVTPLFLPMAAHGASVAMPRRFVSLRTLSFVIVVLLPVAVAAVYYLAIAADQYVAEFRMSLRSVDAPRIEPLALFGGDTAHTTAAGESQIVSQFIASRAIIDQLDPKLDLRRMFASPGADWWARLWLPATAEQLVYYWQNQVDPFYDTSTGTIVVRVRAFTPDDALRLAQAIVASSERLINSLSARARHDALDYAEADVAAAETRLKAALAAIREFRDKEGMIDPGQAASADTTLVTKLRDDLLKANAELATLGAYMRDDAPAIQVLKARIKSLESQQRLLAHEMTSSAAAAPSPGPTPVPPALSHELGSYEALDAERKFAEAAYEHALEALDRARDNADRQHIYIESFVPPSLPQSSLYPHRWRSLGTVALIAFAIWAIGGLTVQSIRDHL
jgi:capsular polysaccharide transport system permease protein